MRKRELKNVEWTILIVAIILCIIGLIALFSATNENEHDEFNKQCIWFVVSIIIMIAVMMIDYEMWVKISPALYGLFIVLLIGVLFTPEINGATSWFDIGFFSLQPGEFAKVFVILFLAMAINKIQEKGKQEINKFTKLLILLAILGVPVLLIVKQPDLGTAAAYVVAAILMIISAGIDKKYIIVTAILIVISIPIVYNFLLPEHAKARIDIFLNPESDPRGAGYNIIQSKIAIGAGAGALTKAGFKTIDRATNEVEGDALDGKEIAKDALSGAVTGGIAVWTMGTAGSAGTVGQAVKGCTQTGIKTGAISGAANYSIDCAFDEDKDFDAGELINTTAESAIVGGAVGAIMGGINGGLHASGVLKSGCNLDSMVSKNTATNINDVAANSACTTSYKVLNDRIRAIAA